MRITRRDVTIIKDLALSHLLYRDQFLELQYFASITRANTRLRELGREGLVRRLSTPFFGQSLYVATKLSAEVVGYRISSLIEGRLASPRFVQHALSVTNVRIALCRRTSAHWRFEQQLWRKLPGQGVEVRPDGLLAASIPIFIEVDMGHVAPSRFKEKLDGYAALADSGLCRDLYGFDTFRLLTVTTGVLRARHLRRLMPQDSKIDFIVQTFEESGATAIPSWS